jgi:muramoyltetrapeptide carboxypeptidase
VKLAIPPALSPGDRVAVVAPSSPFPREQLWPGLAWLRQRYRLEARSGILARDGYLAGDDARRRDELARAMRDPGVRAIVAARGGYGAMRIAGDLPWDVFARAPKWIAGFSDVTALHACAWRVGIASVHAPNVTGLGTATPAARLAFMDAMERPTAPCDWRGLRVVEPGSAEGPIVGGNLALLEATACAGMLELPRGAILAIEDVTERPYRLDRMLTALRLGKHLDRVAAVVLGEFTQCDPGADGRTAEESLVERLRGLRVPLYAGAPFGHGSVNQAFVLGRAVKLEHGEVTFAG